MRDPTATPAALPAVALPATTTAAVRIVAIGPAITKRKANVAEAYGMANKVASKSILVARSAASNLSAKEAEVAGLEAERDVLTAKEKATTQEIEQLRKLAQMAAADAARSRAREQELEKLLKQAKAAPEAAVPAAENKMPAREELTSMATTTSPTDPTLWMSTVNESISLSSGGIPASTLASSSAATASPLPTSTAAMTPMPSPPQDEVACRQ